MNNVNDYAALIEYLLANGETLGINSERLAVWAGSSLVLSAVNAVNRLNERFPDHLRCALLLYGRPGWSPPPKWGKTSVLLVFPGQDDYAKGPMLHSSQESAKGLGIECELLEYPDGVHAFDVKQDTDESRLNIQKIVDFAYHELYN
ncbi:MAG: hypothetical protein JW852_10825 [Spirochaetales bacterium]|nr:hypothetical protein [Spirochaetales bacterium]